MTRKRHTAEEIIGKLREAEVSLVQGKKVPDVCRTLGVSEQTYYRWRNEYGGLKIDQARRLKQLERENAQLRSGVDPVSWTPESFRRKESTMPRTRPAYPAEFRRQMVELVRAGRSPDELAKEFEPSGQSIREWVRRADLDDGRGEDGLNSAEREELKRLRREVRQLRQEREILANRSKGAALLVAGETPSVF